MIKIILNKKKFIIHFVLIILNISLLYFTSFSYINHQINNSKNILNFNQIFNEINVFFIFLFY